MSRPILAIETSCDETAAAVVAGRAILSSVVASQAELHTPYGGVVPEVAARHHLGTVNAVVERALDDAGVTLGEVDAVAVTQRPGLIGALLIGVATGSLEPLQTFRSLTDLTPLPVTFTTGEASITAEVTLYYCEAVNETLCFIDQSVLRLPLVIGAEGESAVTVSRTILAPEG